MMQRDFWKISAVVFCLAFALVLAGCGGTSSPADPPPPITDPALNGTWVQQPGGQVWTFNNGSFLAYNNSKGVFSTSGDTLTLDITHGHGTVLPSDYAEFFEGREWIPIAELIAVSDRFDEGGFVSIWTYKVEGDTLTMTHAVDAGTTWTFTRQ